VFCLIFSAECFAKLDEIGVSSKQPAMTTASQIEPSMAAMSR
jgi:hypothetical protein